MVIEYEALEQFERDQRYIDEHFEELWRRYPDQWIAVYREQFIIFGNTAEILIKRLADNGYAPDQVARRRLTKEKVVTIL